MPITVFSRTESQDNNIAGAHSIAIGQEYLNAGHATEALAAAQRANSLLPLNLDGYRLRALALHALGREPEALAAGMAVSALEQGSALALFNIGTAYFMNRHWQAATEWYRLALLLEPDLVPANQNLASILRQEGRVAEADIHYDRAYRRQSLFIEPAPLPVRNVLILCASRPGNVPFEFLLPQDCNTRIKWVIEYALPDQPPALPHHDLVFNAIGDADTAQRSAAAVERFLEHNDKPVLNPPAHIARTARDRIGALLEGISDIHVPRAVRTTFPGHSQLVAGDATDTEAACADPALATLAYPVIARPTGAHGGDGVVLLQTPRELAALSMAPTAAHQWYLSEYNEYRSGDGYFRKYRVIFVDRKPYPYHLAIGAHWLTHYVTADMLSLPWKQIEEFRFLQDPVRILGQAAWAALEIIGQRLDLDFGGIDFSVLPDGKLLIFEANATMLVHPEEDNEALKYKNWHVHRIFAAFNRLLDRRMGLAP